MSFPCFQDLRQSSTYSSIKLIRHETFIFASVWKYSQNRTKKFERIRVEFHSNQSLKTAQIYEYRLKYKFGIADYVSKYWNINGIYLLLSGALLNIECVSPLNPNRLRVGSSYLCVGWWQFTYLKVLNNGNVSKSKMINSQPRISLPSTSYEREN